MYRLRAATGHSITLPPCRVRVGEAASNEIPIAEGHGLAPVHFTLQPWESGYFLEDAGSGLGTLVNGNPVKWVPLKHGDVITAGDMRMTYEAGVESVVLESANEGVPAAPPQADQARKKEEAPPRMEAPENPPAWLPQEALEPPVPPWLRPVPPEQEATRAGRNFLVTILFLLAMGAVVWFIYR